MFSVVGYFDNWKPRHRGWYAYGCDAVGWANSLKSAKTDIKVKVFDPKGNEIKF